MRSRAKRQRDAKKASKNMRSREAHSMGRSHCLRWDGMGLQSLAAHRTRIEIQQRSRTSGAELVRQPHAVSGLLTHPFISAINSYRLAITALCLFNNISKPLLPIRCIRILFSGFERNASDRDSVEHC